MKASTNILVSDIIKQLSHLNIELSMAIKTEIDLSIGDRMQNVQLESLKRSISIAITTADSIVNSNS